MNTTARFFRDAAASGGAGGGDNLPPSLAELGTGDVFIPGGEDNPPPNPPPNLEDEAAKQAVREQETLKAEAYDNGTLKPGYVVDADGKVSKNESYTPPVTPGLNPDGTLMEGYIKNPQTGEIEIDPNYEEVPPEGDILKVFEEVEKITGRKVEVDYGDVEPDTPQGLALRENAIREQGAVEFENYMKTTQPRAYALMLHLDAGGTEESFFEEGVGVTLPTKEELEASTDVQASLYKYDLMNLRGLDEKQAQALVDLAIKENKLKDNSLATFANIENSQKQQLANIERIKADQKVKMDTAIGNMSTQIQKTISENMGFIVPETERPAFQKFVQDNLQYDAENDKFYFVQPVKGDSLKEMVDAMFFLHKKGDLSKIIARKSKTEAAQGIRLRMKGSGGPGSGGGPATKPAGTFIALGDL